MIGKEYESAAVSHLRSTLSAQHSRLAASPALEEGEVLVQTKASSINPSDVGTVAGVGVPYLAAWQSLIVAGHLQKGERLLIMGASGAVGSAATTQIAHRKGGVLIVADISQGAQESDVFLNLRETELN